MFGHSKLPNQIRVVVAQVSLTAPSADQVTYSVFSVKIFSSYDNVRITDDVALLEVNQK